MVYFLDQVYVCLPDCSNVELLQTLQEIFLLELSPHLEPNLLKMHLVVPVELRMIAEFWGERVPHHHDGEDGLDDENVRLVEIAQLGVFFESGR